MIENGLKGIAFVTILIPGGILLFVIVGGLIMSLSGHCWHLILNDILKLDIKWLKRFEIR